jgi:hypothetical protein
VQEASQVGAASQPSASANQPKPISQPTQRNGTAGRHVCRHADVAGPPQGLQGRCAQHGVLSAGWPAGVCHSKKSVPCDSTGGHRISTSHEIAQSKPAQNLQCSRHFHVCLPAGIGVLEPAESTRGRGTGMRGVRSWIGGSRVLFNDTRHPTRPNRRTSPAQGTPHHTRLHCDRDGLLGTF